MTRTFGYVSHARMDTLIGQSTATQTRNQLLPRQRRKQILPTFDNFEGPTKKQISYVMKLIDF